MRRCLFFFFIGIIVFRFIAFAFFPTGENIGLDLAYHYRDNYDVIEIGPSTVMYNYCNQQLFDEFGIRAVSLGEGGQVLPLSYIALNDALYYQNPSVVILSAKGILNWQSWIDSMIADRSYVHNNIDRLKTIRGRIEAWNILREYDSNYDSFSGFLDVIFPFIYWHNSWYDLEKNNFISRTKRQDFMNGNASVAACEENVRIIDASTRNYNLSVDEINRYYFEKIYDLCNVKGIKLIVSIDWSSCDDMEYEVLEELQKEFLFDIIDINDLKLNSKLDYLDSIHLNLYGAETYTHYLGSRLCDFINVNYSKDELSKYFDSNRDTYLEKHNRMMIVRKLANCYMLTDYIGTLNALDGNYIAVVTSKEGGTLYLKDNILTINDEFAGTFDSAIFINKKWQIECDSIDDLEVNGNSIKYRKAEISQKGDGINIVIIDLINHDCICSVFFDDQGRCCCYKNVDKEKQVFVKKSVNTWELLGE